MTWWVELKKRRVTLTLILGHRQQNLSGPQVKSALCAFSEICFWRVSRSYSAIVSFTDTSSGKR